MPHLHDLAPCRGASAHAGVAFPIRRAFPTRVLAYSEFIVAGWRDLRPRPSRRPDGSSMGHEPVRRRAPPGRAGRRSNLAVLTVSDTRTLDTDTSGALIVALAEAAGHRIAGRAIVPDEPDLMRPLLATWRPSEICTRSSSPGDGRQPPRSDLRDRLRAADRRCRATASSSGCSATPDRPGLHAQPGRRRTDRPGPSWSCRARGRRSSWR